MHPKELKTQTDRKSSHHQSVNSTLSFEDPLLRQVHFIKIESLSFLRRIKKVELSDFFSGQVQLSKRKETEVLKNS